MNEIKALRKQLGLTQEQLANYLQLPLATLAMSELNQRQLPIKSDVRLSHLQLAILQSANTILDVTGITVEQSNKAFTAYATTCLLQYKSLQKKLIQMQQKFLAAENLLKLLALLLQNLPTTEDAKGDRLWIAALEAEAQEKYSSNHPTAQKMLEVKITALKLAEKLAMEMVQTA